MSVLIDPDNTYYVLGVDAMDHTHQEFIDLVNQLSTATDKMEFIKLFARLIEHTESHFESENLLMQESGFAAIQEHKAEHLRVLGELHRFGKKVTAGSIMMGRAYVEEQLPGWFELHAGTMDSALAAHLKALQ